MVSEEARKTVASYFKRRQIKRYCKFQNKFNTKNYTQKTKNYTYIFSNNSARHPPHCPFSNAKIVSEGNTFVDCSRTLLAGT